jgi:hypothetical protein
MTNVNVNCEVVQKLRSIKYATGEFINSLNNLVDICCTWMDLQDPYERRVEGHTQDFALQVTSN